MDVYGCVYLYVCMCMYACKYKDVCVYVCMPVCMLYNHYILLHVCMYGQMDGAIKRYTGRYL